MTTMTHPGYAGRGIFSYLAEKTYRQCQGDGISFVFGFPNKNSYHGFTHRLGWRGQGKMLVWEKPLEYGDPCGADHTDLARRVAGFDVSADSLWRVAIPQHAVAVQRTAAFLNWRFVRNPQATYAIYVVPADSAAMTGFVVLKIYDQGPVRTGHIVDIVSVNDENAARALLEQSYAYFTANGAKMVSCWMPERTLCARLLTEDGFVKTETETYFGFRAFADSDPLNSVPFSEWFLTMGDSDVF